MALFVRPVMRPALNSRYGRKQEKDNLFFGGKDG
jgi:hypothetical protein